MKKLEIVFAPALWLISDMTCPVSEDNRFPYILFGISKILTIQSFDLMLNSFNPGLLTHRDSWERGSPIQIEGVRCVIYLYS